MFDRIKSLLSLKNMALVDRVFLSVAVVGTVALVIGTS